MKKTKKVLGLLVLLVLLLWWFHFCWNKLTGFVYRGCHNEEVTRVVSPDGKWDAVIFIRDSGATTRAMTSLSVLEHGEPVVSSDAGNVFRLDGTVTTNQPPIVKVEWSSLHRLEISYDKNYVVKYANNNGADVPVFFRHLSAPGAP